MKSINQYITEKLFVKRKTYNYFPETKEELKEIINKRIKEEGNEVDLNDIDTSEITDMSDLFSNMNKFNGDISEWDVYNVTNMESMFDGCDKFNQDISNWDVSNVTDMSGMFYECKKFNKDISNWNVSNVNYAINIFAYCPIEEKYKPKFK